MTRVKALTTVPFFFWVQPSLPLPPLLIVDFSSHPSLLSFLKERMKNFRSTQVGTTSPQDILVKRRMSTKEWTDEKHSSYLKFMEATFVNQLYNSKQILGWCSPRATFSHSTTTTSPQLCVRCSSKDASVARGVNLNVEESGSSTSEVSNLGQRRKRHSSDSASPHLHLCHHRMFFSHTDTEMSDQNFVDEEEVCHNGKRRNSKDLQC